MSCEPALPRISIVTPSFNQGAYLEATIRSVLDQKYPNLEYIVLDGGSTDNSVEIIKKYDPHLAYWVSQKDGGQNQAVTEGFKHATGEIYAYLNSDDIYWPWTFRIVAKLFTLFPQIQWLTSQTLMVLNSKGIPAYAMPAENYARTRFYRGLTMVHNETRSGWIQQEATFWRRELWEQAGRYMNANLRVAGDFELWARFWQHANLVTTDIPLAGYRLHGANVSYAKAGEYEKIAQQILANYPRKDYSSLTRQLLQLLFRYTGRGGKRWGSTATWVRYNQFRVEWQIHTKYVF